MHPANRYNLRSAGDPSSSPTTPVAAPVRPPRRHNSFVTLPINPFHTSSPSTSGQATPAVEATMSTSSYLSNIKLDPFQGNGYVDVDTWLEQFERLGAREGITEEQRYLDLQYCLKGNAGLWYSSVAANDASIKDYKTLKEALSNRFTTVDKDDIPSIQQGESESVEQYYYNFIRAVKHCSLTEGQKVKLFVKGLSSEALTYVKLQNPTTLEEARKKAVDYEGATMHQTVKVAAVTTSADQLETLTEKVVEKVVKQLEHLYRPQNRQPRENGYRSQGPVRRNEIGASGHQQSTYRRHQDNRQFQKQGGTRQNPNENQQQNTCPSCRGIKLSRTDAGLARVINGTNIPANSRKDIKVKVSRNKTDGIFLIEPTDSLYKKSLAGAKCLVRVKKRKAVISIMNVTNDPVFLPVDTVVGTLTAVENGDIFQIDETSNDLDTNQNVSNLSNGESAKSSKCANINVEEQSDTFKFDLSRCDLTQEQKFKMKEFLEKNRDLFSSSLKDIGKTSMYSHSVDTEPGKGPVRLPYYKVNPLQRKIIDEEVQKMLDNKIIRESNSIWHSPVVLVKKRDDTYRFAVDYRQLNRITLSIAHPLPTLETVFDCIGDSQAKFFSTLDMASEFWQVPMDPKTRHKAAFCVPSGIYEFDRMPFGLKNAPMSFQMLMTKVLGSMNWKQALCFIDDILVFSPTFEQHLSDLELLFQKLRGANLTLKPEKCHFAQEKVKYLGHILSKHGIQVDSEKTKAVDEFPIPTNQRALRSFLGLCNYYRKFVKNYSKIAVPLNELLQKDKKFIWENRHQEAFESLKHALVTAPMIHYPDMNHTFILTTDASDTALAYILGQKGSDGKERVVSYGGRALRSDERKWGISDKECLAVYEGILAYRQYLSHRKFDIYTDHKSLKWLDKTKNSNSRLYRWSMELAHFDYNIIHRPGRVNQNADALSRREYTVESSVSVSRVDATGKWNRNTAIVDHDVSHVSPADVEVTKDKGKHMSAPSKNKESTLFAAVTSVNDIEKEQTFPKLETIQEESEKEDIDVFEQVEVFFNYDNSPSIMKISVSNEKQITEIETGKLEETFNEQDSDSGNNNEKLRNSNSDKELENEKQLWETHEISKYQKECEDFKHIYNYLENGELPKKENLARKTILESDNYQLLDKHGKIIGKCPGSFD
ncbi:uncharacterized protein LOC132755945 [Ruditapes philippinarum]|uniref:uncharacterized protein LOC132755945 n=1 Tax=Ruditapes philippinarum TaxID=129788 RepID=UPI00295BA77F|nr:uncharacterized protein LOC132755945 [Ruditapes philippinarum]